MEVSKVTSLSGLMNSKLEQNDKTQTAGLSFNDLLKQSVSDVNKTQVEGYSAMEGIATGKVPNLQEAVQKIEEAELSLKLALEVKNKALNAYKEVMRMQV